MGVTYWRKPNAPLVLLFTLSDNFEFAYEFIYENGKAIRQFRILRNCTKLTCAAQCGVVEVGKNTELRFTEKSGYLYANVKDTPSGKVHSSKIAVVTIHNAQAEDHAIRAAWNALMDKIIDDVLE